MLSILLICKRHKQLVVGKVHWTSDWAVWVFLGKIFYSQITKTPLPCVLIGNYTWGKKFKSGSGHWSLHPKFITVSVAWSNKENFYFPWMGCYSNEGIADPAFHLLLVSNSLYLGGKSTVRTRHPNQIKYNDPGMALIPDHIIQSLTQN